MPIKLLGFFNEEARFVMESEEVLLAIIQSLLTKDSNFEKKSLMENNLGDYRKSYEKGVLLESHLTKSPIESLEMDDIKSTLFP